MQNRLDVVKNRLEAAWPRLEAVRWRFESVGNRLEAVNHRLDAVRNQVLEPVAKRERTGLLILLPKEFNPKMKRPNAPGAGSEDNFPPLRVQFFIRVFGGFRG